MEAEGGIQTGKKGGALRVSQLSDPLPVCPVPPTPTPAVSGWEGWLSLGQVWSFFFPVGTEDSARSGHHTFPREL